MNSRQTRCKKLAQVIVIAAVVCIAVGLSSSLTVFAANADIAEKGQFNKTVAYMVTSAIAFALLLGYCALTKKKEMMFILLFTAVFIINLGYAFGSSSTTLEEALLANKIAYVGSVFLPLIMLIIIMDECRYTRRKLFLALLMCISSGIFFLTMTPGYTPWYYKSAELIFVNGGAKLVKVYGPLHKLYFVYLVLYFYLMVAVIVWAIVKKKHSSPKIPLALLALVFGNIVVWFIEQKISLNYEFLSISYLVTEVYLLGLYNAMYQSKPDSPCTNCIALCNTAEVKNVTVVNDDYDSGFIPDMQDIINAWPAVAQLTTREVEVFKELILNKKRKDIAEDLCVSENTVKKHTTNIFTKLGVSSRAEIMNMLLKIK
ncbi:MAG: hypothetical protein E7484_04345 [Ruminococcaceae bacterium]|nr:hypothetical protein [Oscillospiraceae bacterium]